MLTTTTTQARVQNTLTSQSHLPYQSNPVALRTPLSSVCALMCWVWWTCNLVSHQSVHAAPSFRVLLILKLLRAFALLSKLMCWASTSTFPLTWPCYSTTVERASPKDSSALKHAFHVYIYDTIFSFKLFHEVLFCCIHLSSCCVLTLIFFGTYPFANEYFLLL